MSSLDAVPDDVLHQFEEVVLRSGGFYHVKVDQSSQLLRLFPLQNSESKSSFRKKICNKKLLNASNLYFVNKFKYGAFGSAIRWHQK